MARSASTPGREFVRRLRKRRRKSHRRSAFFESLEDRRLLASDWQNSLNEFDVNDDGLTSPIDVLNVINHLNRERPRALPETREPIPHFWMSMATVQSRRSTRFR